MDKVCALCRVNTDLQNSHIISELFYLMVYDVRPRRFHVISSDPIIHERYEQKGIREYLLCKACEQRLGRWEDYVKRAFVHGKGVTATPVEGGLKLHGIDYKTFKLFLLSLLWRMSVSTLEFFRLLKLEPEHNEKLRVALLDDDPLQPEDYSCILTIVKINGEFKKDWILQPSQVRNGTSRAYWLVINGIVYMFFISGPIPAVFRIPPINRQNEMFIMEGDAKDHPFLKEPLKGLSAAIQQRKKSREASKKNKKAT
jgi:hypothetical protein